MMKLNFSLRAMLFCLSALVPSAYAEGGIHDKGSIYVFWGWNRSQYSKSDIHFKGNGYDFTLSDVTAADRQTAVGIDPYFRPDGITLPQTNFKVGYFIADNLALSFGVDHMKYVMDQNQMAKIEGYITGSGNPAFDKTYVKGERIDPSQDGFLKFEHTDGLNHLNLEINRFDELYRFSPDFSISAVTGAGVGILMPRTNVTLFDKKRHDEFHFAGWGTSVKAGIEFNYKRFFTRTEVKYGYIDMPDIRTTESSTDKASQHFTFTELDMVFGYYF
jgi:hypothetical protein